MPKIKKEKTKKEEKKLEKYYQAIGRRKTAIALVCLFTRPLKSSERPESFFLVNEKPLNVYFKNPELQQIALASLKKMKAENRFKVIAKVKGGGPQAQAEAIRHATARALVLFNPDYRKRLKRAGFLTRDQRMKERKKFGLKRARRAPQWQKR
jgi:small subunit ribosomal protein S9